jgi:hypothetical protein
MSPVKNLRYVWKTTTFLSHIQPRSHDDRFPIPLWETWFCQSLGVPIPVFLENPRQCPYRQFSFDHYGDHIQTCHRLSNNTSSVRVDRVKAQFVTMIGWSQS